MDSKIHFESCKNGDLTCSFQGKYLHSKYNPKNEGERFVQNIQADFSPLCVFIIEPALSYCAPFLRQKFPKAKICAIRFTDDFSETDGNWDFVFHLKNSTANTQIFSLCDDLFDCFGEENLISSIFFDWTPTKQAFASESLETWNEIKKAVLKARDVLGTRSYFAKRWLKNSLIFAKNVRHAHILQKVSLPVIVAASGPSLKTSLPYLKKFRESFFLIALSSAFMPLSKHGITPDLVISSDGGYWAKKHLEFSGSKAFDAIFTLEAEGAASKKIISERKILPLIYNDGLEKDFLDAIGCPYMISERNGTVAGTALQFALNLTDGNVYLCGLDQAPAPAFQHTQPNSLETDNARKDFRLRNAETRISASRFNSAASLEIYRNWFISNSECFKKRTFRLSDNFTYEYALGKISEVNWNDFAENETQILSSKKTGETATKIKEIEMSGDERQEILFDRLKKLSETERFKSEVFPMDLILIRRETSSEQKQLLEEKLAEKIKSFLNEIRHW